MIRTVLFDLDGTFADTAPDLAYALNETLLANGRLALPYDTIRPVVSHGARALVELGFQLTETDPLYPQLRQQLLDIYASNITRHTTLFTGVTELLASLTSRHINWGIVTNKPGFLTEPLMRGLGLFDQASCIISGDTLPVRKPDPAPLLHACQLAGSQSFECVYIGDAERDIIAGERAGMHTLIALFGYLGEQDQPDQWGADALVKSPGAILEWIEQHNQLQLSNG